PAQRRGEGRGGPQPVEAREARAVPQAPRTIELRAAADGSEGRGDGTRARPDDEVDLHAALVERAQDAGVVGTRRPDPREHDGRASLRRVLPHLSSRVFPTLPPAGGRAKGFASARRTASRRSAFVVPSLTPRYAARARGLRSQPVSNGQSSPAPASGHASRSSPCSTSSTPGSITAPPRTRHAP